LPWLITSTLVGLGLATLWYLLVESTTASRRANLLSHVVETARASLLYSEDHDDRLPIADTWQTAVTANQKFPEANFHSMGPRGVLNPPQYIAFRDKFSGSKVNKIPDASQAVLTFDSTITHPNAHGELDQMPNPPRFNYGGKQTNVVAFVDGHAKIVTKSDPIR